jgi:hypothetical protein
MSFIKSENSKTLASKTMGKSVARVLEINRKNFTSCFQIPKPYSEKENSQDRPERNLWGLLVQCQVQIQFQQHQQVENIQVLEVKTLTN